jgi:hypothetical protein
MANNRKHQDKVAQRRRQIRSGKGKGTVNARLPQPPAVAAAIEAKLAEGK